MKYQILEAYKNLINEEEEELDEDIRKRIKDDLEAFLSRNKGKLDKDQIIMIRRSIDVTSELPESDIIKSLLDLASYFPNDAFAKEIERIMSILINKDEYKLEENKMDNNMSMEYKSAYKAMILGESQLKEDGMGAAPGGPLGDGSLGPGDARVPFVVGVMKRGMVGKCACQKGKKRCEKCGQIISKHKKMIQDCLGAKFKVKELDESDESYNYELTECEKVEESTAVAEPEYKL